MKLLLVGNPNCGKSAVFSRITGTYVMSSNYPGTTVSYTTGTLTWDGLVAEVVDVPGIYSLTPSSKAEQVATDMIHGRGDSDVLLNIVDATHLERGLYLALELIETGAPMILVLNMWDEARHKGVRIDVDRLSSELGIPVVPTSALTGEGFTELLTCVRAMLMRSRSGSTESTTACGGRSVPCSLPAWNSPARTTESEVASSSAAVNHWRRVGEIVHAVQTLSPRRHSLIERIADATLDPVIGPPIALAVIAAALLVVITAGETLIESVLDPLFNSLYAPLLLRISSMLGSSGMLHDLLIGRLVEGAIDFESSLGLLSTGIYVPLAMVLPYVTIFYLVLSFLEDLGYLARLAVLADSLMHRVGLHGHTIVSMVLGAGCNVPGVLSARCLECRRQRFIAGPSDLHMHSLHGSNCCDIRTRRETRHRLPDAGLRRPSRRVDNSRSPVEPVLSWAGSHRPPRGPGPQMASSEDLEPKTHLPLTLVFRGSCTLRADRVACRRCLLPDRAQRCVWEGRSTGGLELVGAAS